ncbi:MAG TPA: amphi-Trp domain-containing protein [Planctomycetota bacterium]|nr:amphi-Trp domain-containing protein [Planctomycetota bacterium]
MGEEANEFEHDSLQDRDQVVAYLRAVADGIDSGALRLSDQERTIELRPVGLMAFGVRAQSKRSRVTFSLRLSWKVIEEKNVTGAGDLRIDAKSDNR